jgi:hypothetical protein
MVSSRDGLLCRRPLPYPRASPPEGAGRLGRRRRLRSQHRWTDGVHHVLLPPQRSTPCCVHCFRIARVGIGPRTHNSNPVRCAVETARASSFFPTALPASSRHRCGPVKDRPLPSPKPINPRRGNFAVRHPFLRGENCIPCDAFHFCS